MWITLGIGIAGFFSMMAMGYGINRLFYLNPFYLIVQPTFHKSFTPDLYGIVFSIVETIIFITLGVLFSRRLHNE